MTHADEMRTCLDTLDVDGIRKLWAQISPHLPQPKTEHEAIVTMHIARTSASSISDSKRFYSHRWLLDNGYPSSLPDQLKPSAERMYPTIVQGVGISENSRNEFIKPVTKLVERAMADVVEDIYADNRNPNPNVVKKHMMEVRSVEYRKLLGLNVSDQSRAN